MISFNENELRGIILRAYSSGWDCAMSDAPESEKLDYADKVLRTLKNRDDKAL